MLSLRFILFSFMCIIEDWEFGWGGTEAKFERICQFVFSVQLVMAVGVEWYKDCLLF